MSTRSGQQARPARRAKSEQTRGRILNTALGLFNEQGTAAVSTNHVAAEAGLSPGNLYYHFTDKQEIIRALHERYAAANEDLWEPGPGRPPAWRGCAPAWPGPWNWPGSTGSSSGNCWRCCAPTRSCEPATGRCMSGQAGTVAGLQRAARGAGAIRPPQPPATIADLATAVWLIGAGWMSFLEITGDPQDPGQVARGADLVLAVLGPYLTGREDNGREQS